MLSLPLWEKNQLEFNWIIHSGYALNLKALIEVSKVSWTSQLSYEILRSLFESKFGKTNFMSSKKNTSQKPATFRVKV